jgi:hypothetical protein
MSCTEVTSFHALLYTKGPGNFVFSPDEKASITGNEERGWAILSPDGSVEVKTAQGIDIMLEELGLPHLGWQ